MRISITILLVFISSYYLSQKGKISGYTLDTNNEIIPNVTIYFDSIDKIIIVILKGFTTLLSLILEIIQFILIHLVMRKKSILLILILNTKKTKI